MKRKKNKFGSKHKCVNNNNNISGATTYGKRSVKKYSKFLIGIAFFQRI